MFSGRVGRLGFLLGLIYYFVATLIPLVVIGGFIALLLSFIPNISKSIFTTPLVVLFIVWCLLIVFCCISLVVRRLHDLNRSGKMAWLLIIPLFNLAVVIYILIAPGIPGANAYGASRVSNNFGSIAKFRNRKVPQ